IKPTIAKTSQGARERRVLRLWPARSVRPNWFILVPDSRCVDFCFESLCLITAVRAVAGQLHLRRTINVSYLHENFSTTKRQAISLAGDPRFALRARPMSRGAVAEIGAQQGRARDRLRDRRPAPRARSRRCRPRGPRAPPNRADSPGGACRSNGTSLQSILGLDVPQSLLTRADEVIE